MKYVRDRCAFDFIGDIDIRRGGRCSVPKSTRDGDDAAGAGRGGPGRPVPDVGPQEGEQPAGSLGAGAGGAVATLNIPYM